MSNDRLTNTTRITIESADRLMAEIVEFLEAQGMPIPKEFDYEGLTYLIHRADGKFWSNSQQIWRKIRGVET